MIYNISKKTIAIISTLILVITLFLPTATAKAYYLDSADNCPAVFYLFRADYYNVSYTSVAPFFCEWVGKGTITSPQYLFNDPSSVSNIIVSAPSIEGTNIEWGTCYSCFGYNIVIGRPITTSPIVDEVVEEVLEENLDTVIEETNEAVVNQSDSDIVIEAEVSDEIVDELISAGEAEPAYDNQNSDAEIDDSSTKTESFSPDEPTTKEYVEPQNYVLSREEILSANSSDFNDCDTIKWSGFLKGKRDVADGVIPVSLLDDPVYTSMNLPSETRSDYLIKANRDNGHIIGNTDSENTAKIVSIGSLYPTTGTTLPEKITINLGKIKLFAYSIAENRWVTLSQDSHPTDAMIYEVPWTGHTIKIQDKVAYDDHLELTVNGADLQTNTLHFWGTKVPFDKTQYKYYACAYEFWVEDASNGGLLTSVVAIDTKATTGTNTVAQLISSRGVSVESYTKTNWGTTIPNCEYDPRFGQELQELFNK